MLCSLNILFNGLFLMCFCRFIAGGLLSYTFLPFITVGSYDRRRKLVLIGISLGVAAVLLTTLVLLLYVWPIQDSSVIQTLGYLNCIPITRDFCAEQNIHFNKREISITWIACPTVPTCFHQQWSSRNNDFNQQKWKKQQTQNKKKQHNIQCYVDGEFNFLSIISMATSRPLVSLWSFLKKLWHNGHF